MTLRSQRPIGDPPDSDERRLITEELDRTMLVEAAAGTGKTTSMVERIVKLLQTDRCTIDQIAAVTFTRKSAAELRSRLQSRLTSILGEGPSVGSTQLEHALDHLDRCFIGTIHSFCGMLLRERPLEAGVPLDFEELEPDVDFAIREEAWSEYVERLYETNSDHLADLEEVGLSIHDLHDAFLLYADYPDVEEWPTDDIDLGDIKGLTESLQEYIEDMRSIVPQFPRDRGNDQLMSRYESIVRLENRLDLSRPCNVMTLLAEFRTCKVVQGEWPGGRAQGKQESARWLEFIDRTASPALRIWQMKRYSIIIPILGEASTVYDDRRRAIGGLNYQDLLVFAARLLREHPGVREYFRNRITHLLVDEFQDTDPLQAEVMFLLTATNSSERNWRKCRPKAGSLFVVGDPKQSIYRFRRADIVTYNQSRSIIEQSGGLVVSLTANFRTRSDIVEWGNEVFGHLFPAQPNAYSPPACPMLVGRQDAQGGDLAGIQLLKISDDYSKMEDAIDYEAGFIARTIRHALDEGLTVPRSQKELQAGKTSEATPDDFLIIARNKKHLAVYGEKLTELGIPCQLSGASVLPSIEELRLFAGLLRCCLEPNDSIACVGVLRSYLFGISDSELFAFRRAGGTFRFRSQIPSNRTEVVTAKFQDAYARLTNYSRWLNNLPILAALERIVDDVGLLPRIADTGDGVKAGSFLKIIERIRANHRFVTSAFDVIDFIEEQITSENGEFDGTPVRASDNAAVRVMNLHKAKGLEAPVVFLASPSGKRRPSPSFHIDRLAERVQGYLLIRGSRQGMADGPILARPLRWEDFEGEATRFEVEEENRLLYVAATRAGAKLVVTQRSKGNNWNFWNTLSDHLTNAEDLIDPGPQHAPVRSFATLDEDIVSTSFARIEQNWRRVCAPTYSSAAVKQLALAHSKAHLGATGGEHGTEWGTVIHFLLEIRMRDQNANLSEVARIALEEQDLNPSLAEDAIAVVEQVVASMIWKRAVASEKCLMEVPIMRQLPPDPDNGSLPTILRGVIDLAFRERQGWTIVDYKTDRIDPEQVEARVEHYWPQIAAYAEEWNKLTGEPVHEVGLFFTAINKYVVL